MEISVKKFKSFVNTFNKLGKFVNQGSVDFITDYSKAKHDGREHPYDNAYSMIIKNLKFKTIAAAFNYTKLGALTTHGLEIDPLTRDRAKKGTVGAAFYTSLDMPGKYAIAKPISDNPEDLAKNLKSMRFIPKTIPEDVKMPYVLQHAPFEVMEGNHTYRIVNTSSGRSEILIIGRDDEPIYDYLDKGFFIRAVKEVTPSGKETRHIMVTNELNVHTMHIFFMVTMQAKLCTMLKNGCFVHSSDAQLMRLKMEKKLLPKHKKRYDEVRAFIEKDYQSNTSLLVINKIKNGEIEKSGINEITITKESAHYENIKIEAPDLLEVLYDKLNFGGEFDIYTIVETYTEAFQKKVTEKDVAEGTCEFPIIKINGFDIAVTKNSSGVRKVNGKRINSTEIKDVIYRASCHHNLDEYNLFVRRISKMSLRWHDAIANGLQIKIHSNITHDEYKNESPSSDAPAIKFWIDPAAKCIKIRTEDPDGGKVSLGRLIDKVSTINKKTNEGWSYKLGETRNYRWARKELVKAIRDCCTFSKTITKEDGTTETNTWTTITKEDIAKLIDVADEAKKKAIERSKAFLEGAVKTTGAELIEFLGKKAYKVKGGLREYAIVVESAKVYDFNTKQYRCIVNDNHFRGAGYDDIAARLYVLKNDSVMQDKIGTLKGAAQPQYENHHNDYQPDRAIEDVIDQIELA